MGIRETLNENPRLTTGITVAIVIVVLLFIVYQIHSGATQGSGPSFSGRQYYYSDDDGKTYFPDDANKVPPFDHKGKEADRARVYKCDGKTFVNHLERYTPEGKKKMETLISKAQPVGDPTASEGIEVIGKEYKRPGDKEWVKQADQAKRIAIAEANAQAVTGENLADAKVAQSQATLLEQKAEAYERGEGRKRSYQTWLRHGQLASCAKPSDKHCSPLYIEGPAPQELPPECQDQAEISQRSTGRLSRSSAVQCIRLADKPVAERICH